MAKNVNKLFSERKKQLLIDPNLKKVLNFFLHHLVYTVYLLNEK